MSDITITPEQEAEVEQLLGDLVRQYGDATFDAGEHDSSEPDAPPYADVADAVDTAYAALAHRIAELLQAARTEPRTFVESFAATMTAQGDVGPAIALVTAAEQNYGAWNVSQIEAFFRDMRELLTRLAPAAEEAPT